VLISTYHAILRVTFRQIIMMRWATDAFIFSLAQAIFLAVDFYGQRDPQCDLFCVGVRSEYYKKGSKRKLLHY
jgi:hypothetical protein